MVSILVALFFQRVSAQAPNISYPSTNAIASGTSFTVSPANSGGAVPATTYGQVTTFAGSTSETSGRTNGTGTAARFNIPEMLCGDASGNLYVADNANNEIRKITSGGVVTLYAGSASGTAGYKDTTVATGALFNGPAGVAMDGSGNLFVADHGNNVIRKITPSGVVSTFYTRSGMGPTGLTFDGSGNLIVAAQSLSLILKITPAGVATTIAGNFYAYVNGTGTGADFKNCTDAKIDASGNIFVADYLDNAIRKITSAGVVTTYAGSNVNNNTGGFLDGVGTAAKFNTPTGVAVTPSGIIYVADFNNHNIRRIMPDGTVTLVAGSATQLSGTVDGTGTAAKLHSPMGIYVDNTGTAYVADMWASIRKVVLTGYTLKGTLPAGLTFSPTTGTISGTPTGTLVSQTDTITAYNATGYSVATVTFTPLSQLVPVISYASGNNNLTVGAPVTISPSNTGGPVPATAYGQVTTFVGSTTATAGYTDASGTSALFNWPQQMARDSSGNTYIADANNNVIRKITPAGAVSTFAGSTSGVVGSTDATGTSARFNAPDGIVIDGTGTMYVSDYGNNAIRKITSAGVVTTLYSTLNTFGPGGLCFDGSGNLIVTAQDMGQILKITPAGVVSSVAGSSIGYTNGPAASAQFDTPSDVRMDASGNIYVVDFNNNAIRKITPAGVVSTIAGSPVNGNQPGFADGVGTAAIFNNPAGLMLAPGGVIYVADMYNNDIRRIMPDGTVTLIAGSAGQVPGNADGTGTAAGFNLPDYMYMDGTGTGYIAELGGNRIRKMTLTGYSLTGTLPAGLAFDPTTGIISGTPTAVTGNKTFTVTAFNTFGTSSTTISISTAAGTFNPSQDQNYIVTYTPRIPIADATTLATQPVVSVNKAVQYIDGLGRPLQTVQNQASAQGRDVVQPIVYDQFGRESVKYLPYALGGSAANDGSYNTNSVADQGSFYTTPPSGVSAVPFPYAQTAFEPSPLNRVVEQGAPGDNWQPVGTPGVSANAGHTIKTVYATNNSISWSADSVNSMQVALYNVTINPNKTRTLSANGYYGAGQLYVTISKDENWISGRAGTIEEYKDKEGHVILKRVYNYTTALQVLSTYYVYDDLGNLAFVLPPAANGDAAANISQATLDNFGYQYRYDQRDRLIQKKIPGKGWEFMVYNMLDQVVMTQDANQRKNAPQQWTFTKYDGIGRPVMTGMYTFTGSSADSSMSAPDTTEFVTLRNLYKNTTNKYWENRKGSTPTGYDELSDPVGHSYTYYTTTYYDNYSGIPGLPSGYTLSTGVSQMTTGLATAKKTAVLNTPADQLWDVMYYDDFGRATQTFAQHYLGGTVSTLNYDQILTTYNFPNQPTTVTRKHWNTASTTAPLVTIANTYLYDQVGRKVKTWEQITNGNSTPTAKTLISKIDYNEVGQVLTKHLHSTDSVNFYQDVAYTYNERGWLLTSSAPLFAMSLFYNTAPNAQQYNGNILTQYWGTPGSLTNHYSYAYDKLNRLTSGSSTGSSEQNISYDMMGNLTALNRYASTTLIDQLAYTYTGNQLTSITDATTNDNGLKHGTWNYTYDGNGNLVSDPSKGASGIHIAYNLLNLPQNITGSKTITYTYDVSGNKLRRVSTVTGKTDYIAGIQYDDNNSGGAEMLSFIQTEEGRAVPNGSDYNYEYNLSDNLGDVRLTFDAASGSARKIQQDDYYPFGMEINALTPSVKNEYLYNKKELQEELSEYDYGARFYDPVIGRWNVVDAYAEHPDQINLTPYNYVGDNPISRIDPDGNCPGPPCDVPNSQCYACSVPGVGGLNMPEAPHSSPATNMFSNWSLNELADTYDNSGTALTTAGYSGSVFGPEVPATLVPAGELQMTIGTSLHVIDDLNHGNVGTAIGRIGVDKLFGALGKLVKNSKGIETAAGKMILRTTVFAGSKVADKLREGMAADHAEKKVFKAQKLKTSKGNDKFVRDFFNKSAEKEQKKKKGK